MHFAHFLHLSSAAKVGPAAKIFMMRRRLVLTLLAFTALSHAGPTENTSVRHDKTYGSDDKWWKCNVDASKGCDTGPLETLGLTAEEQTFARGTLDRIPWHPKIATTEEVSSVFGKELTENFGYQKIKSVGPGTDPQRGVMVHRFKGYVHNIKWYQPGRFLLVKDHFFP